MTRKFGFLKAMTFAGFLVVNCATLFGQSTQSTPTPARSQATESKSSNANATPPSLAQLRTPATHPAAAAAPYRFPLNHTSNREALYYGLVWGVESLNVKLAESGEIIRFSYHVVNADKAKPLNDKKSEPALIDPQAGVQLVVPSLEQVGQLRQSSTPEAGKSYWMAFSNSGRVVKHGDRINVVIGQFHADGLMVE